MKKLAAILLSFLMMANLAVFTSFAQETDIEITSLETLPEKQWGYLEGVAVSAPEAVTTNTNIEDVTLTPVWAGVDGFNFGDKPEGNALVAYTAAYTAPDGYVFADSLASATENTFLSADKKVLTYKFYTYVIPSDAIYIDDKGTNSTDDYAEGNLARPYGTIAYAMGLLESKGGGVIVIVDKITETTSGKVSGTMLSKNGHYTIMGWDKDSMLETTGHYNLCGNTTFRDLNIHMTKSSGGIYARGYDLTMGDKNYSDLVVTQPVSSCTQLFMTSDGNLDGTDSYVNPGKITINSGAWSFICASGYGYTVIDGDVEYEINGGTISTLALGLHCGNDSKPHVINGDVKAVINGGTVTKLNLGSYNARYLHNGNCDVTVNGGTIKDVFFRSESANYTFESTNETYPVQNGDYTLKINGGTFTGTITDKTANGYGVTGSTEINILDYDGDKDALLAKINTEQFDTIKSQIIYVDATNGADTNDGLSPENALATMTAGFKKFAGGVSGKMVLIGDNTTHVPDAADPSKLVSKCTDTKDRGAVIITGYDENSNFTLVNGVVLAGDTTFENIHIVNSGSTKNLFAGGYTLIMGEGITSSTTVSHHLQIGNGSAGASVGRSNIIIHSGTYGLIYSGSDYNGGRVTGNADLTIYGGNFTETVYAGGFVASAKKSTSDDTSGKIDGRIGLYIHGGTFDKTIYIGGNQYGTVGSIDAKITGGTFKSNLLVGPNKPSGTYIPTEGEPTDYVTDVLGDTIIEITGGTFNSTIGHTGNGIDAGGKRVVIASNGTAVSYGDTSKFDYFVTASSKGTTLYDKESDKFSLVPVNAAMDIYINDVITEKADDNLYTLSGAENNLYNINYGGESAVQAQFVITQPIAELTPVTKIIQLGGKNTYNDIGNCTVSDVTWEPAHDKFRFDTQYKATVVLTAVDGVEFSDDFSSVNINNKYDGNTVECTLSEDKTQITVTVTFPKTAKSDLELLADTTVNASVTFTTSREEEASDNLHATTVTLTNAVDDSVVYSGIAEENGTDGIFNKEIKAGIYNIKVKKQGYIEETLNGVMIDTDNSTVDMGALIPGDIIDGNGSTIGDGIVDIDDFTIALRALAENVSSEITDAANISEAKTYNVSQLGFIKSSFSKNAENDASDYGGYFENTYYRLKVDKELNVGYIGGSIIQGASEQGTQTYNNGGFVSAGSEKFIDRMQQNLEKSFPEAKIYSINAGISDTGSNFGLFRLGEDMMLREEGHIPDLVFLEFCVNDFGSIGLETIELQYESLINAVYKINPKADIVCMLTAMDGYEIPKQAHINVASHYDIPIVDVGAALRKDYDIAGDCKVFTNDNLHPNGAGYEYYTKLCWNLLEKYIVYAAPEAPRYKAKVLPEQYKSGIITNPAKLPVTDESVVLSEGSSWKTETNKVMSRIFDAQTKIIPCITSSTVNDAFTFSFTGDAFGFIIKQSPAMGSFEYSVDGGDWVEFKSSKSYTHYQTYLMETNLENKEHTVTVRVTGTGIGTQAGCEVGIAGILYNDLSE